MSTSQELDDLAATHDVPDLGGADVVQAWVRSQLPRLVTAASPFVVGLVTAVLAWLQNAVGIDLQAHAAAYAAFVGTLILGGLGLAATWVFNAGKGQIEIAKRVVDRIQDEARTFESNPVPDRPAALPEEDPIIPPGMNPDKL